MGAKGIIRINGGEREHRRNRYAQLDTQYTSAETQFE